MKKFFIFFIFFLVGCGSIPFEETQLVTLEGVSPEKVVENFQAKLPENFKY